jgi:hypothetical protein
MQKLLVPLFLALLCFPAFAPACFGSTPQGNPVPSANATPFLDDLKQIDAQMTELEALEQWIGEHQNTYADLVNTGNPLANSVLPDSDISSALFGSSAPGHERLMDIPGFLWGFCCSFVGVFLMYLSIDDPAARKKEGVQAIIGCGVGTLIWVGLYIWLVFTASYY